MDFSSWTTLTISDVFDTISKYGDVENVRALRDGPTRYISTTKYNNGLARMVTNTKYTIENGECITVGIDGSFSTFYQPYPFIRTTNIAVLRSKHLNKYNALFLITVIRAAISKYYYGVKLKSSNILESTPLFLPTVDEQPNWLYMTEYIKKIYSIQVSKYTTSVKNKIDPIDFSSWRKVKLVDIFDYERGQRYIKEHQTFGKYPYVSSSEDNNGIDGYVSPSPRSVVYENALTIANSGSRGVVFYHEGEFVASDHVTVLWIKTGKKLTKKIGLFMKPIIEKNAGRYLFNKEINKKTINEIDLFLPYKNDEPDWDYMEHFIDCIPNSDLI